MPASSHDLAAALAARLGPVLPSGLTVRADGDRVSVHSGETEVGGSAAAALIGDEDGRSVEEKIETASRAVLGGVQDAVAEWLTEPWPEGLAAPGARVAGGHLHLWYGEERAPVLGLSSVDLADMR
ncbi:hypothetical protein ACRYCC_20790 [Actinomadura scrupuli]|uniref:hypothetical protein n=1 Tax=Actinomadura scrupuli TaxID=559629 RepID=UPI003D98B513